MSRQDEKKLYEQQEEKILAQSDAFISLLTKRGILADQKIDSEKVRSAKQEKTRNSYHNTLMLLQQYRTIVWMMECFPETIVEELETPFEGVDALIEHMDVEMAMGNRKLENRIEGVQKSRLLFVFDLFGPLKALYGEASRLTVMNAALDRIEEVLNESELPDKGTQHISKESAGKAAYFDCPLYTEGCADYNIG